MPAIYRQIQIKVIPQGAAADRPIGEMRQALTLFCLRCPETWKAN